MIWRFENLWDGNKWLSPAIVETNKDGLIQLIHHSPNANRSSDVPPLLDAHRFPDSPVDREEEVQGWAVPGFTNAHSHAFQFAMAGLTESPQSHIDNFWSWRHKMYEFALRLTPCQMEAVATNLYSTMLKNGYTWVAEFHYLHHDTNGKPYSHPSEMGQALLRAAEKTGIGITLIPIFYNQGGFNREPHDEQRRFVSKSIDDYLKLHSLTEVHCSGPRQNCALGLHSLRAIKPEQVKPLVDEAPSGLPWHIHVAEQKKEVADCLEILGQRPIQWLINNVAIDENWHLVHATHVDEGEKMALQKQQVHVVFCPSTEGNLGDGVFPLKSYWQGGGHWSIGSDSHMSLNPLEELRWLDYVQRLDQTQRNVLCRHGGDNSGRLLFNEALASGRMAMGLKRSSQLQRGDLLDLVVIRPEALLWQNTSTKNLLSTLVYATTPSDFSGVITSGKWVIKEGRHTLDGKFFREWEKVSPLRGGM